MKITWIFINNYKQLLHSSRQHVHNMKTIYIISNFRSSFSFYEKKGLLNLSQIAPLYNRYFLKKKPENVTWNEYGSMAFVFASFRGRCR